MNRLDELLERFEYVAQERDYGSVNLHYLDVVYLASVLRAGRELRGVVLRYDDQCRDHAASNYDNAIAGGDE